MKDMAAKRVMVEINLASDDLVLGITGKQHLFSLYRKFGVPMTLSTDDEGVSRIDLTHEYVRAVETYVLGYTDLQQLVRNSLEYGFLPGASLWAGPDFARFAQVCENDAAGAEKPSSACETFLTGSEKAEQQ
jgi:adenosine deaminase